MFNFLFVLLLFFRSCIAGLLSLWDKCGRLLRLPVLHPRVTRICVLLGRYLLQYLPRGVVLFCTLNAVLFCCCWVVLAVVVCFVFFVVVCFVVVLLFLYYRVPVVVAEVRAPVETSCAGPLGDAHLCSIGPAEWMMDRGVGCVTFSSFSGGSHGDVGGVGDILTSGRVTHNEIKPRGVGASGVGVPAVRGGRVEASVGSSGAGVGVSVVGGGHVGSGGADGAVSVNAAELAQLSVF